MGVIKNDVGRPSNKTIMVRKILKLILVLIVIGLAVTLGYFIKDNEETKLNNRNDETTEVRKDISNEEAEKVITRIFDEDYAYNFAMGIEIYNDKEYQTAIAIMNTRKSKKEHDLKEEFNNKVFYDYNTGDYLFKRGDNYTYYYENKFFEYDSVNKVYKDFFGNKNDASKEDILLDYVGYLYSEESNSYAEATPIWGDGGYTIISDVIETKLKNDALYITVAYGSAGWNDENDWTLPLTDETEVKLTDAEIENKGTCEKYKDKLKQYKFKFILEDDVYKFVSVEKVK